MAVQTHAWDTLDSVPLRVSAPRRACAPTRSCSRVSLACAPCVCTPCMPPQHTRVIKACPGSAPRRSPRHTRVLSVCSPHLHPNQPPSHHGFGAGFVGRRENAFGGSFGRGPRGVVGFAQQMGGKGKFVCGSSGERKGRRADFPLLVTKGEMLDCV